MALYATNRFAGDGTTTQYEINFVGQYIDRSHVKAYRVDDATQVRTPVTIAPGQWLNATTITGFTPTPVGQTLVIYRETPKPPLVDFVNGSRFTEYNMDLVARQGLFVAMEAMDAGDAEAREQLLAAITTVAGLVDDATAAVSDATQAALEAAASASNSAGSATLAQDAKVAAEAANSAAQTARSVAQASATAASDSASNASTSASSASTSASAAAGSASSAAASASTASTHASNASTSASNAASSATAASTAASNAASSAATATTQAGIATTKASDAEASAALALSYSNLDVFTNCKLVRTDSSTLTLTRFRGKALTINGVHQVIPQAGVTLSLTGTSGLLSYVYAWMNGGTMTLEASGTAPTLDAASGMYIKGGDSTRVLVGGFTRRAGGFMADRAAQDVVSLYNQGVRYLQVAAASSGSVGSGATTIVVSGTFTNILASTVSASAGGQTTMSSPGYGQASILLNGSSVGDGAAVKEFATGSGVDNLVARLMGEVPAGSHTLGAALAGASAGMLWTGGQATGWVLYAELHPPL